MAKEGDTLSGFYQSVTLVLADGRRLRYAGRAQLSEAEIPAARVVSVALGVPLALPAGVEWEVVDLSPAAPVGRGEHGGHDGG